MKTLWGKIKKGFWAIVPACPATGCGFSEFLQLIHNLLQLAIDVSIFAIGASVLWGGFLMLTSGGDAGKYEQAKGAVTAAVVGTAIIFLAWGSINFVIMTFTHCTGQWNVFGDLTCI